jgi:hypothetical protein
MVKSAGDGANAHTVPMCLPNACKVVHRKHPWLPSKLNLQVWSSTWEARYGGSILRADLSLGVGPDCAPITNRPVGSGPDDS